MNPIQVLIVDDHSMVRVGLRTCLTSYQSIVVVGEASNGREALQEIERHQPQVVLMDLVMPEMGGVEAIGLIKKRWPAIRVIALTSFAEEKYIILAMEAGADGYLIKDVEPHQLVKAIHTVHEGQVPLDSQAAKVIVNSWRRSQSMEEPDAIPPCALTPREIEVLGLMAQGKSNRSISQCLVISEKTVKAHVSSILEKLQVENRVQAIAQGRALGVLPPAGPS